MAILNLRAGQRPCKGGWNAWLRPQLWLLRAVAFVLMFMMGGLSLCWAQTDAQIAEYRVKAAFLYKFGDYIEWPSQAFVQLDSPLVMGIMGADFLADELTKLVVGRTIGGRPIVVRKLKHGEMIKGVHLLFVGRSELGQLGDILAATKGQAILTVTESEQTSIGGVINFIIVDDKVRFDIALQQAEQNNLKISARLLAVARKVVSSVS